MRSSSGNLPSRTPVLAVPTSGSSPKAKSPPSPSPMPAAHSPSPTSSVVPAPPLGYSPLSRSGSSTESAQQQLLPSAAVAPALGTPPVSASTTLPLMLPARSAPVCIGVTERTTESSSYMRDQAELESIEEDLAMPVSDKYLITNDQLLNELVQGAHLVG